MRRQHTCILLLVFLTLPACGMRHIDAGVATEDGYTGDEDTPAGNANSGDADQAGQSCLEIYNAISVCYSIYYECSAPCQDQACADACEQEYTGCFEQEVQAGSTQGQTAFSTLRTCEEESYPSCYEDGGVVYNDCAEQCSDDACTEACGEQASVVLQNCLVDACYTEYSECGVAVEIQEVEPSEGGTTNDSSGSDNPQNSNAPLSCGELYNCEDACNGNRDCGQACYDRGNQTAQAQWTQLIECGQMMCDGLVSGADDYRSCLEAYCGEFYQTCFSSTGSSTGGGNSGSSGTSGTTSCEDGYTCVQGCYGSATDESSFYSCLDGCYSTMDAEANALMDSLVNCSQVQCADVPGSINNYYRCIEDFCPEQYQACMDDVVGSSGTSTPDPGEPDSGGTASNATCLQIHESVVAVCVPAFSTCSQACTDDACMQACNDDITACIEDQKSSAPSNEVANFDGMLGCRNDNYQACYSQANEVYSPCISACSGGDSDCQSSCNQQANEAYEGCYSRECASEYEVCGIE